MLYVSDAVFLQLSKSEKRKCYFKNHEEEKIQLQCCSVFTEKKIHV